jgi:hypothetical protein
MDQPEILDSDIRAMQQWLRAAWEQLADPSRLQKAAEQQSAPLQQPIPTYTKPELRILSW